MNRLNRLGNGDNCENHSFADKGKCLEEKREWQNENSFMDRGGFGLPGEI